MRIAIDIKCLRYNNSGIGRYLRCMLDCLQNIDKQNEYLLCAPEAIDYKIWNDNFKMQVVPGVKILGKRLPGIFWQQTALPKFLRQASVNVFWGPEQTLPIPNCNCKRVLTVHDFVHKRYPQTMRKTVLWINNSIGKKSIEFADKVVTVSGFTFKELVHFYPNTDPAKIQVVPCGCNVEQTASDENLQRKRQLLFVGSLEPRKNLASLIKALEILKARGIEIPLVMTGPKGWKNTNEVAMLANSPVAKNIFHKGFVSDNELIRLYKESACVVFPSLYEGFGLPVLESLKYKTPILTSKNSVMEAIALDCGIYFNAREPESIANTIEEFFKASEPWQFLKNREKERLAILEKYRWVNSAKSLLQIFESLGEVGQ